MAASTDTTSRDVAQRLRSEINQRLSWYDRVLGTALGYFAMLNGGGLVATVVVTGFLIQLRRPAGVTLMPALLFTAGLVFIGLFHLGHALIIRNWAKGKFRVHRSDEDEFSFIDDHDIVHRLFSHLHLWPAIAAALCGFGGLISGLSILYQQ